MKSTWVAAGLLLVTICQAEHDETTVPPTTTPIPEPLPLAIQYVTVTTTGDTNDIRVCYQYDVGSGVCPSSPKNLELTVKIGPKEFSQNASDATPVGTNQCCSSHGYEESFNIFGKNIVMVLLLTTEVSPIGGIAKFTSPAEADLPKCDTATFLTEYQTLRITCNQMGSDTWHSYIKEDSIPVNCLSQSESTETPGSKYCYTDNDDIIHGNSFSICDVLDNTAPDAKEHKISLCISSGTITVPESAIPEAPITSEIFDYDDPVGPTLTITPGDSSITRELVSRIGNDPTGISPIIGYTNILSNYTDQTQEIHYLLVEQEYADAYQNNIPGYDLAINALSVYTLEVNWINVYRTDSYKLTSSENTIQGVEVSCGGDSHCYGYLMSDNPMTASTVEVTPSNRKPTQTIKRAYSGTSESTTEAIEVRGVQLQRSDERQTTEAEICFQHQTTEPQAYEVVIINSQGEWRRGEGIVTLTSRGVSCIKPMVVLETEFLPENQEITVIVLQRDEDSRKVLASGEAKINANISY